jgi:ATP phosphoribosyltransferase regulatory subunit HisZ
MLLDPYEDFLLGIMEDLKRPLFNTMPELNMSSLGFRTDFRAWKKILLQLF